MKSKKNPNKGIMKNKLISKDAVAKPGCRCGYCNEVNKSKKIAKEYIFPDTTEREVNSQNMTNEQTKNWEEIEKLLSEYGIEYWNFNEGLLIGSEDKVNKKKKEILDSISNLLSEQRKEVLEEVEKLGQNLPYKIRVASGNLKEIDANNALCWKFEKRVKKIINNIK